MLFQTFSESENLGFTDRFENMHPWVQKGAQSNFRPLYQLDVGLELMGNWAVNFDEPQVVYSNWFFCDIAVDVASGEHFDLLQKWLCNGSSVEDTYIFKDNRLFFIAAFVSLHVHNAMHCIW